MTDKYEFRAVLFLDILGFKRLIDQNREDIVEQALSVTSAHYQSNYEVSSFSDNMVVSIRFERGYELLELINFSSYLSWHLIHKGVLSRGGIAVGNLHHKNGTVYGPALLAAYQLESQVAIYPRIVLERNVVTKSIENNITARDSEDLIRVQCRTDFDGWEHVHLMGHQALMPFDTMLSPSDWQPDGKINHSSLLQVKVSAARAALANNPSNDIRASSKHEWMKRYIDFYENIYNHGPQWRPLPIAQAMLDSVPNTIDKPDLSAIHAPKAEPDNY